MAPKIWFKAQVKVTALLLMLLLPLLLPLKVLVILIMGPVVTLLETARKGGPLEAQAIFLSSQLCFPVCLAAQREARERVSGPLDFLCRDCMQQ